MEQKIEKIYPLTPLQSGMLSSSLLFGDGMYVVQKHITIYGELDKKVLDKTLEYLLKKYEILRTFFVIDKLKEPMQAILKERKCVANYETIIDMSEQCKKEYISEYVKADKNNGFDLTKDLLIRLAVLQSDLEQYELIWTFHHIILDGWSTGIILNDFMTTYTNLRQGKKSVIQRSDFTFDKYILWLRKNKNKGIDYWKSYLDSYETTIAIFGKKLNNASYEYIPTEKKTALSEELTNDINLFVQRYSITLNLFFEIIWGILLQKHNMSDDAVYGYVTSGRNAEITGIEEMVGLFLNTVPIRIQSDKNITFVKLIKKIYEQYLETKNHEFVSLLDIQEHTFLKDYPINHILVFENYPFDDDMNSHEKSQQRGFTIGEVENIEQTNYDLNIVLMPEKQLSILFLYNEFVFKGKEITDLCEHLINIANQVIKNPEIKISDISLIGKDETELVAIEFNNTSTPYPNDKTVAELFEWQAIKTPDKTAVVFEDKKITYAELNRRANQLARKLRNLGIKPDDFVAIMSKKSVEMIVGLCGIVKSGAAYVPIDSSYPSERINLMLEDCKPKVLLLAEADKEIDTEIDTEIVTIDLLSEEVYTGEAENLEIVNKPEDLVYLIYTSGSTGKPKAAMIEHKSVIRLVKNTNYVTLDENSIILQSGALSFDASTFEIWGMLLNGGQLCVATNEILIDSNKLKETINKFHVNLLWLTSALFNQIITEDNTLFEQLTYLLIGGEKVSEKHVRLFKEGNKHTRLINGYGPTENTTFTTTYEIPEDFDMIPIGRPISNTQVYILNGMSFCGIGIPGELCTTGEGVARGYLNRSELTDMVFVDNPFGEGKLYRTGDLARWMPDGNIEYLGRIDNQVKIRGFRIELSEIEHAIRKVDDIKDAAVIVKNGNNGEKCICAYFVSDIEIQNIMLKRILRKSLPEYMVPAYTEQIERIPVSLNGKIDKQKLERRDVDFKSIYKEPENDIEKQLCELFEEILGIKKVGREDNFFELGGHSLKATLLGSKIQKTMNISLPLADIFKHSSIKDLAICVEERLTQHEHEYENIPVLPKRKYYPLSSAQENMWSAVKLGDDNGVMNIVLSVFFENIDLMILQKVIIAIADRHQSLRTRFEVVDGTVKQRIGSSEDTLSQYSSIDISNVDNIQNKVNDLISEQENKPFDLEKGYLVRITVAEVRKNKHLFILAMHHIISDAWSMDILFYDMIKYYLSMKESKEVDLQPLDIQYTDFAVWEQKNLQGAKKEKLKTYWDAILKNPIPVLDLYTDFPRPLIKTQVGRGIEVEIDPEYVNRLRNIANQNNGTMFIILLTCMYTLLYHYTGQEDIIVGTPVAGREHIQLQDQVGFYLNVLPLRTSIYGTDSLIELFRKVKETALGAFENQSFPFSAMLDNKMISREQTRSPLFDVMIQLINERNENVFHDGFAGVKVEAVQRESIQSKYDLVFNFRDESNYIKLNLEYNTMLFKHETVLRMIERYKGIMRCFIDNKDQLLNQIEIEEKINLENITIIKRRN